MKTHPEVLSEVRDGDAAAGGSDIDWLFASQDLRISRWSCSSAGPEWSTARAQPWHVLGFPHRGAFVAEVERREVVIDPNSVLFLNPGQPYRTRHPFGGEDRGSSLVVSLRLLREILARFDAAPVDGEPRFPRFQAPSSPRGYLLQRLLYERLLRFGERPSLEIEEVALELAAEAITECLRHAGRMPECRRPDTERSHRARVEAAKGLLFARFREPLTLDEIADRLAVSPFHLSRMFKSATGLPIHRYLNRLRLRAALERVADRPVDLTELALDLGFSSHSHFTASFGREFGLPSVIHTAAQHGRLAEILARVPAPDRPAARGAASGMRPGA